MMGKLVVTTTWRAVFFVGFAMCLMAPALFGQTTEERLGALERKVKSLEEENAQLKEDAKETESELESLRTGQDTNAENLSAAIAQIDLETLYGAVPLLKNDNGFVHRMGFGGEWRTRVDFRHNTSDLLSEFDDTGLRLDYRFNLGLRFDLTEHDSPSDLAVSTWFEIQAAGRGANNTAERINSGIGVGIGDYATRDNDLDILRLYQAFIKLDRKELSLKVGRQEIYLGSGLIMGSNDFFTGTVHDAIRLDYDFGENSSLSLFYAKEAASDGQVPPGFATGGLLTGQYRASGDEDEVMGLYYEGLGLLGPVDFDAYYFFFNGRGENPAVVPFNMTSPNDPAIDAFGRNTLEGQIHTVGFWTRSDELVDDLFLSLEVAYQLGAEQDGDSLDALLVEFASEYNLPIWEDMRPKIYLGYYFAEGPDANLNNGFSPMFITRHANDPIRRHGGFSRFGNIDLIPSQNVHVIQAGFKFEPDESWTVGATWLYAWANHSREGFGVSPVGEVFLANERGIGHEIDLYAEYQYSAQTDFFLNASVFFPQASFFIDDITTGALEHVETDIAFGLFAHIQVRF